MRTSPQPLAALTRFAEALGWPDLRMFQHTIDDDVVAPQPFVVTRYESGASGGVRTDFFLQMNEAPAGQSMTYAGAVDAMRYRICSGGHAFTLYDAVDEMQAEATRVGGWLHRRGFETLAMRREFRRLHPECAGYSWPRIRQAGTPYSLDDLSTER